MTRLSKMSNYWGVFPEAHEIAKEAGDRGRIIIVRPELFRSFILTNGPFLDGKNLYWQFHGDNPVPRDLCHKWRKGGLPWVFPTERVVVLYDPPLPAYLSAKGK